VPDSVGNVVLRKGVKGGEYAGEEEADAGPGQPSMLAWLHHIKLVVTSCHASAAAPGPEQADTACQCQAGRWGLVARHVLEDAKALVGGRDGVVTQPYVRYGRGNTHVRASRLAGLGSSSM
jgi:hypothetical protein